LKRYRITVKRTFGTVTLEGNTPEELLESLVGFQDLLAKIDGALSKPELVSPKGVTEDTGEGLPRRGGIEVLTDLRVVEMTQDGPLLMTQKGKMSDREAIGILLYAMPTAKAGEIFRLMKLSGRDRPGLPARLSELRREGLVVKDGEVYRLSSIGREWAEEAISRLRSGRTEVAW